MTAIVVLAQVRRTRGLVPSARYVVAPSLPTELEARMRDPNVTKATLWPCPTCHRWTCDCDPEG